MSSAEDKIRVKFYSDSSGEKPVATWLRGFKDIATRAYITARIGRLEAGNFNTCKPVGEGVHELIIDHGPGYRLYFANESDRLILMLAAGAKDDQQDCIDQAKAIWRDHQDRSREKLSNVKAKKVRSGKK